MHASGSLYKSELVGVFSGEAVCVSSRGGRVFAPGLRYMEAEKGAHCWESSRLFVPSWSGLLQSSEAR